MATYAQAKAERNRLMANYRISARIILFDPGTNDWRIDFHDMRMEGEKPAPLTPWPNSYHDLFPQNPTNTQFFYP